MAAGLLDRDGEWVESAAGRRQFGCERGRGESRSERGGARGSRHRERRLSANRGRSGFGLDPADIERPGSGARPTGDSARSHPSARLAATASGCPRFTIAGALADKVTRDRVETDRSRGDHDRNPSAGEKRRTMRTIEHTTGWGRHGLLGQDGVNRREPAGTFRTAVCDGLAYSLRDSAGASAAVTDGN